MPADEQHETNMGLHVILLPAFPVEHVDRLRLCHWPGRLQHREQISAMRAMSGRNPRACRAHPLRPLNPRLRPWRKPIPDTDLEVAPGRDDIGGDKLKVAGLDEVNFLDHDG